VRKPEQKFYDLLRDHHLFPGHHCRVENSVGAGQGDVNVCYQGVECWFELKVGNPEHLVDKLLLPSQLAWHQLRTKHGGRVWVLVLHQGDIFVYKVCFCDIIKGRYLLITQLPSCSYEFIQQFIVTCFKED
jgi:hypothetical protein